jgi:hypothetical protein
MPPSGLVVRPKMTSPARRSRATISESTGNTVSRNSREPWWEARPHRLGAEVLEEEGHALERAPRQPGPDRLARVLLLEQHDRVQHAVARLHARKRRVEQRLGANLPPRHELGEPQRVVILEVHGPPVSGRSYGDPRCAAPPRAMGSAKAGRTVPVQSPNPRRNRVLAPIP